VRSTWKDYDERDTLFARIRLRKGTKNYETYYRDKEERRQKDDPLRGDNFLQNLRESAAFKKKHLPLIEDFDRRAVRLHEESLRQRPAETKVDVTTEELFAFAKAAGACDVAALELTRADFYSHHGGVDGIRPAKEHGEPVRADYPRALIFCVGMDRGLLRFAPRFEALHATKEAYYRVAKTGAAVARHLQEKGHNALFTGEHHYIAPLVPLAERANLGQRGMLHVLVHPVHGPSIRLGAVFTDAPIAERKKPHVSIKDFCKRCALCLMNCPTQAIKPFSRDRPVFDEHKCYKMFQAYGTDCGICLKSCPFTYGIDSARLDEGRETIDRMVEEHLQKHGRIPKPLIKSPFRKS